MDGEMRDTKTLEHQKDMSNREEASPPAITMKNFTFLSKAMAKVFQKLNFHWGMVRIEKDDKNGRCVNDLPGDNVRGKAQAVQKNQPAKHNPKFGHFKTYLNGYITNENTKISELGNSNQNVNNEGSDGWHDMKKQNDSDDVSVDDSDDEQIKRPHPFRGLGKIEGQPRPDPKTNEMRPYYVEVMFALDSQADANFIDESLVKDELKIRIESRPPKIPILSISGHEVMIEGEAELRYQLSDPQGSATFFRSRFLITKLPDCIPKVIIGHKTWSRHDLSKYVKPVNEIRVPDTSPRMCAAFVRDAGVGLTRKLSFTAIKPTHSKLI